jgi:hypothetical protein
MHLDHRPERRLLVTDPVERTAEAAAQRAKASRLRKEIAELTDSQSEKPAGGESPHEFIQRRMRELNQRKNKAKRSG